MISTAEKTKQSDPYLAHYESMETAAQPAWLKKLRQSAISYFAEMGFPSTDHEDWRYTNVAPLVALPFRPALRRGALSAGSLKGRPLMDLPGCRMVFVNGFFNAELSCLTLPPGVRLSSLASEIENDGLEGMLGREIRGNENAFAALNTALFQDGAYVFISKGVVVADPIHLVFITEGSTTGLQSFPRVLLVSEADSKVTVLEHHLGWGDHPYISNGVTEIIAGENAFVEHCIFQDQKADSFHVGTLRMRLSSKSQFWGHSISLGSRLSRNNIYSHLDGEHLEAVMNGLYLVDNDQLSDHFMIVEHSRPNCNSHEYYNGILDGKSRGVFHGRILVQKHAIKTDAKQTNKNLLLSDDATIDTKPQLEIYADDVKCTHGATIGQLDEESVFYLRSRGISAEGARRMLIHAFAGEIIDRVQHGLLREQLDQIVWDRLEENPMVSTRSQS